MEPHPDTAFDRMPIGDSWRRGRSGQRTRDLDPYTGEWAIEAFTTDQWLTVQHMPRVFPRRASEIT